MICQASAIDVRFQGSLDRAARLVDAAGATIVCITPFRATVVAVSGLCVDRPLDPLLVATAWKTVGLRQPQVMIAEGAERPHRLTVGVDESPTLRFVAAFVRDGSAPPFCAADLRNARQLQGWIGDVIRLWWHARSSDQLAAGLGAVADRSCTGLLLLDGDGRVLRSNPVAEAFLQEGDGLRRTGSMVTARNFDDSIKLQTAIQHCLAAAEDGLSQPDGRATVLAVRRRGRRPLMAAVLPLPNPAGMPMVAVQVIDPDADNDHLVSSTCALYGLTRAEARLATQLAAGTTLAEAAERLKVQPDTARAYLKQVFAKTGVNRQAALVQLLLQSQVRLRASVGIDAI